MDAQAQAICVGNMQENLVFQRRGLIKVVVKHSS